MTFDTRSINLDKLNSMTKYPSIELYHKMNDKYRLTDELNFPDVFPNSPVFGSEKIDGTNSRIILMPDGYFILGSREELIYAKGDLIGNPVQKILATLGDMVYRIPGMAYQDDRITVIYGEAYGGRNISQNSKQYSHGNAAGYRVFDIMVLLAEEWDDLYQLETAQIAAWRDHGNQPFLNLDYISNWLHHNGCTFFETVPHLFECDFQDLPLTVQDMYDFMLKVSPSTLAALDADVPGIPEGIVLRTYDRKFIAKARREDYEKTLKIRR